VDSAISAQFIFSEVVARGSYGRSSDCQLFSWLQLQRSTSCSPSALLFPSPLDMPLIQVHWDADCALENFFLVGISTQCLSKVLTSSWIEHFLHDHCFTEFSRFLTSSSCIIKTQTVFRHGYWSILGILYVCVHDSRHFYILNQHDTNLQKERESGGKLWI
jgi:hypothetical protein